MSLFLALGGLWLVAAAPASQPVYLDESITGARYCLNPDSPMVRKTFSTFALTPETKLEGAALAEDVRFLHQLLRSTYAGYPEYLQHRTFDVDRFFESWHAKAAASPSLTVEEGVIQPLVELRHAVTDHHLGPDRLLMALADDARLAFSEYAPGGRLPGRAWPPGGGVAAPIAHAG